MAKSFVLVGDHLQLPPTVRSKAAVTAGYGVSLLRRLAEANEARGGVSKGNVNALAKLTMQYRMHEDIALLCNEICYGGQLKCGNDDVRYRKIKVRRGAKDRKSGRSEATTVYS